MALGATAQSVIGMFIRSSRKTVVIGIVLGVAGALFAAQLLRLMLFGGTTYDVTTLIAVCLLIAVVAAFASWLPAQRAAAVDSAQPLRNE